ncbi:MAG: hypothetical protein A2X86_04895 [Bdellovibrionales bacterium GWA2_49_15]|nr:MAG: hypothetical protein A2X86_04895 [Bdellovibrionales bacterium GWA2_49_15]
MVAKRKQGAEAGEEQERPKYIIQKYRDRLNILRHAQEFSQKDDIPRAVTAYMKYLESLAEYFEITEDKLHPELFAREKNLAEILLISQVYWDLAKAYDRSPRLKKECERCLKQFVKFSLGFKFQFINSEMLRKFMKKRAAYNPKLFSDAFQKLKLNSRSCYIATYSFHENSMIVYDLRQFKQKLVKSSLGSMLTDLYYRQSPNLIDLFIEYPNVGLLANSIFIRPLLRAFTFFAKII